MFSSNVSSRSVNSRRAIAIRCATLRWARRGRLLAALAMIGLASLTGCGGTTGAGGGTTGATTTNGVKQYTAAQLPPVVQEIPALDGGRIEIPTPDGWNAGPRATGLLARFHLKGRSGIPQILVKADAAPAGVPDTITADNVLAYADLVQKELDAQVADKKTTVLEPAKPMMFGSNAWVRYVIPGKLPNKDRATLERQILRTVQRGRVYSIDLQVEGNELPKSRDHAYAMAAGIKFSAGTDAAAPPPEVAAPAGDAPAAPAPEAPPAEAPKP